MFNISLRRGGTRAERSPRINGSQHGTDVRVPLEPWSSENGVREIREYKVTPGAKNPGSALPGRLLGGASVLIFGALVGAGFVAYEAQRLFAEKHNHTGAMLTEADKIRALIVAALPDVGWIAMALIALVAAMRGQSSLRARIGIMVFFGLSLSAQVLYAPRTPEGVLVAVIAPISLAWMLETLIIEVRRWAGARLKVEMDESPILTGVLVGLVRIVRGFVGLILWVIRLTFDRRGTWSGVREWVLDTAPLAPGRTRASLQAAAAIEQADVAAITAARVREDAAAAAERAEQLAAAAHAERDRAAAEVARISAEHEALRAKHERREKAEADLHRVLPGETKVQALIRIYTARYQNSAVFLDRGTAAGTARDIAAVIDYNEGTARRELGRWIDEQLSNQSYQGTAVNGRSVEEAVR
ncbi:hypothetical protein [Streptosporangium canum]|uniref:hypothetical protein n=1 Tax=Streptosporangium canum TaxID=324952 RepID=UPI00379A518A